MTATYDWACTRHVPCCSLWRHPSFPTVVYGTYAKYDSEIWLRVIFFYFVPPKGRGLEKCDCVLSPVIPSHISLVTKYPICCSEAIVKCHHLWEMNILHFIDDFFLINRLFESLTWNCQGMSHMNWISICWKYFKCNLCPIHHKKCKPLMSHTMSRCVFSLI